MKRTIYIALVMLTVGCSDENTNASGDSGANTAFQFANLRVEEVSATRAVVRFDTSEPTTCEAEYGTSMTTMDQSATDPSMAPNQLDTVHDVPLEDLVPDTTYYYRARATDKDGRTERSNTLSFKTLPQRQSGLTNVALMSEGTTVSAVSSNFGGAASGNSSSFGANNAIDGSMVTEWSTNGDGDDAFIVVDFGKMRTLSRVGFRSRRMTDGSSIIKSFRLIFMDQSMLGPFDSPDPDQLYVFDFATPVSTQTVRLEAVTTTGGNSGAKEIQFFEPSGN